MAQGGFYFDPNEDAMDNTTCPSCHLSLQGWELGDKPFEEHKSRKPRCAFIKSHPTTPVMGSMTGSMTNEVQEIQEVQEVQEIQKFHQVQETQLENSMELDKPLEWPTFTLEYLPFDHISTEEKEMTVEDFLNSRFQKELNHLEQEYEKMINVVEVWGKQIL